MFATIFMPFWLQLGAILGLKLEPSWLLKSSKSRPKRLPRRTWEPEPPQTSKIRPKWPPDPKNEAPDPPCGIDFDINFGYTNQFLKPFWKRFCTIYWLDFWLFLLVDLMPCCLPFRRDGGTRLCCAVGYSLQLAQMFYYEIMTHNEPLWGRLNSIGEIRCLAGSSVDVLIRAAASAVRPLQYDGSSWTQIPAVL